MQVPGWELNQGQKPNFHGFVVIGAGLPRTGTNSLRTALNVLLDGSVYHMFQVMFGDKIDPAFWQRALKRKMGKSEWKDFLEGRGFRGGVDFPIAMFYKQLMEVFPEAKIVLTVREPETWYESVKNSIYQTRFEAIGLPTKMLLWITGRYNNWKTTVDASTAPIPFMDKQSVYGVIGEGKEASVEFYKKWVEEVKRTVPKDRLLIFSVKEGWKPLCEFLDVPIPDQPFPRFNDTKSLVGLLSKGSTMARTVLFGVVLVFGLTAYLFREPLYALYNSYFGKWIELM